MTTDEFQLLDESCIAVLPVAAIEQHGPHLPVSVDSVLNEGVLTRALELLPDDVPVTVLPMMSIGKSNEHSAYPGTLSLSTSTLIALWTDIAESVARAGVRKLVLFNAHGGQPQIMDVVARDMRVRHNMFVVTLNWFSFGVPEDLFPEEELRHGIHGGAIETSMMMHLAPDLVKCEELADFKPTSVEFEREYTLLSPEGAVGFGWQTQDLHPSGACGNALLASAEAGEQILEFAAAKLVTLMHEVHAFPLSNLKDGPLQQAANAAAAAASWKMKEANNTRI